jgi:hypothetical protein
MVVIQGSPYVPIPLTLLESPELPYVVHTIPSPPPHDPAS